MDISANFLCNIENGNRWISPQTLVKFASALNVEPYELFKPAEALPPEMPLILNKCLDEAVVAVTQTLNQIRGYYLPQAKGRGRRGKGCPLFLNSRRKLPSDTVQHRMLRRIRILFFLPVRIELIFLRH